MRKKQTNKAGFLRALIAIIFLVILLGLAFFVLIKKQKEEKAREAARLEAEKPDPFESLFIEAKAAYVYDIQDQKVLFEKNPGVALPLASLTKIMTAMTALDREPNASSTVVTIDQAALAEDGGSGLLEGERWKLDDLIKFTLIVSSNDGARAIGNAIDGSNFINDMNVEAAQLGLSSMTFSNPTGLDLSTSTAGSYGSARDMAVLLQNSFSKYADIIGVTKASSLTLYSESGFAHKAINTDTITASIPGLRASKTGFTDLAGGNLGIIFDVEPNHPVVAVVLGSTVESRFTDMSKIVNTTYQKLADKEQY